MGEAMNPVATDPWGYIWFAYGLVFGSVILLRAAIALQVRRAGRDLDALQGG